jgi:hypothetical protein
MSAVKNAARPGVFEHGASAPVGAGSDVLVHESGVQYLQLTVPDGIDWSPGDIVFRPKRDGVWRRWDGKPLDKGVEAERGGVVHSVQYGIALVLEHGRIRARNVPNFNTAKQAGLFHQALVAE